MSIEIDSDWMEYDQRGFSYRQMFIRYAGVISKMTKYRAAIETITPTNIMAILVLATG
ncbi:MAG: hypothetical protein WBQ16_03505 [Nitrososphaeraceae archaeon]